MKVRKNGVGDYTVRSAEGGNDAWSVTFKEFTENRTGDKSKDFETVGLHVRHDAQIRFVDYDDFVALTFGDIAETATVFLTRSQALQIAESIQAELKEVNNA